MCRSQAETGPPVRQPLSTMCVAAQIERDGKARVLGRSLIAREGPCFQLRCCKMLTPPWVVVHESQVAFSGSPSFGSHAAKKIGLGVVDQADQWVGAWIGNRAVTHLIDGNQRRFMKSAMIAFVDSLIVPSLHPKPRPESAMKESGRRWIRGFRIAWRQ